MKRKKRVVRILESKKSCQKECDKVDLYRRGEGCLGEDLPNNAFTEKGKLFNKASMLIVCSKLCFVLSQFTSDAALLSLRSPMIKEKLL